MNKDSELKTRITAFLVLLAALLVVFAGFLGFFRDYGNIFRQGEEKTADVPQDIVVKWQNAVENGDMKNAFIYASQIVPDSDFQLPNAVYTDFFDSCGQPPSVLTSPWTPDDFRRWQAWLAQSKQVQQTADMDTVLAQLQKAPLGDLFDLAALYGFDAFAVRILNSDPQQELYEFRKDGKAYTMFAADRKLARGTAQELVPQDAKLIHLYPAQLADYRRFNQLLFRRIESYLGRMPRPPAEALIELKEKYPWVILEMVSPFDAQAEKWTPEQRARHDRLFELADITTATGHAYDRGCMFRRNRYLIDNADLLLAAYDGQPGGTAMTCELAERYHVPVMKIKPTLH